MSQGILKGDLNDILPVFNVIDKAQSSSCHGDGFERAAQVISAATAKGQLAVPQDVFSRAGVLQDTILKIASEEGRTVLNAPTCWVVAMIYLVIQFMAFQIANTADKTWQNVGRMFIPTLWKRLTNYCLAAEPKIITTLDKQDREGKIPWAKLPTHPLHHYIWTKGNMQSICPCAPGILEAAPAPHGYDFSSMHVKTNTAEFVANITKELQRNLQDRAFDGNPETVTRFLQAFLGVLVLASRTTTGSFANVNMLTRSTLTSLSDIVRLAPGSLLPRRVVNPMKSQMIFTTLFVESVKQLRASFRLYGNSCVLQDKLRSALFSFLDNDGAITFDPKEITFMQTGKEAGALDHRQKNRLLLLATLKNCVYIDRVHAMLPFMSHIFSVDNIPRLLLHTKAFKTSAVINKADNWKNMFFSPVDRNFMKIVWKTLDGSIASIAEAIAYDSKYVYKVAMGLDVKDDVFEKIKEIHKDEDTFVCPYIDLGKPKKSKEKGQEKCPNQTEVNIERDPALQALIDKHEQTNKRSVTDEVSKSKSIYPGRYISYYHLFKLLQELSKKQLTNATDGNEFIIEELYHIIQDYLSYVVPKMHMTATFFKQYEREAQAVSYASSRSAVLTYVKVRANEDKMLLRHGVYLDAVSAQSTNQDITRFVVRYCSDMTKKESNTQGAHEQKAADIGFVYDETYSFGPFTRVFGNQHTNDDVADGTYEVVHKLSNQKSVVVMGFGISGAGKTSTLIYKRPKNGAGEEPGIVLKWLERLMGSGKLSDGVVFTAVEFYGRDLNYDGDRNLRNERLTSMWKPLNCRRKACIDNLISCQRTILDNKVSSGAHWRKVTRTAGKDKQFLATLGNAITTLVEDTRYRETKPTPNNDSSSRSHVIISFKISSKVEEDADSYLHVVDLAGVENKFDKKNADIWKQFGDIDRVQQTCEMDDTSPDSKSSMVGLASLNTLRLKRAIEPTAKQPCTCFERYVYNEKQYPFIADDAAEEEDKKEDSAAVNEAERTLLKTYAGVQLRKVYLQGQDMLKRVEVTIATQYEHAQHWGSIILNPFAAFQSGKLTFPVMQPDADRKKRAAKIRRSLFDCAADRMKEAEYVYKNRRNCVTKKIVLHDFCKLQRGAVGGRYGWVCFPEQMTWEWMQSYDFLTHLPAEPFQVWEAVDGCDLKLGRMPLKYLPCDGGGSSYHNMREPQFARANEDYPRSAFEARGDMNEDMYLVPRFIPAHVQWKARERYGDVTQLSREKLTNLSQILDGVIAGKPLTSKDFNDVLGMMNAAEDATFLDKVLIANGLTDPTTLRQFMMFFEGSDVEGIDLAFSYVCMVYETIINVFTNQGNLRQSDPGLSLEKATAQPIRDANDRATMFQAFACDGIISASVSVALFVCNLIMKKAEELPWNKPGNKIITVTTVGAQFDDAEAKFKMSYAANTDASMYSLKDLPAIFGKYVSGANGGYSSLRLCNLPMQHDVGSTACNVFNVLTHDDLTYIIDFLHETKKDYVKWVSNVFTLGLVVGKSKVALRDKNLVWDAHQGYYMDQRTAEGKFINFTVNNMRESMNNVVMDLQNRTNPYGIPGFVSACSFFGCHPFLDRECYKSTGTGDARKVFDPIFAYISAVSKLQKNKEPRRPAGQEQQEQNEQQQNEQKQKEQSKELPPELHLCMMCILNLSSPKVAGGVLDPPAVRYIRHTTILHALRMWDFVMSQDAGTAITPATETSGTQRIHPCGDVDRSDKAPDMKDLENIACPRVTHDFLTFKNDVSKNNIPLVSVKNPVGFDIVSVQNLFNLLAAGLSELYVAILRTKITVFGEVLDKIVALLKEMSVDACVPQLQALAQQQGGGYDDLADADGAFMESYASDASDANDMQGGWVPYIAPAHRETPWLSAKNMAEWRVWLQDKRIPENVKKGWLQKRAKYEANLKNNKLSAKQAELNAARQREEELRAQQQEEAKKRAAKIAEIFKNAQAVVVFNFRINDVRDIVETVVKYNTASLIGNLAFVDSLQKRGGSSVCDLGLRHSLYTANLPEICTTIPSDQLIDTSYVNLAAWKSKPETYKFENLKAKLTEQYRHAGSYPSSSDMYPIRGGAQDPSATVEHQWESIVEYESPKEKNTNCCDNDMQKEDEKMTCQNIPGQEDEGTDKQDENKNAPPPTKRTTTKPTTSQTTTSKPTTTKRVDNVNKRASSSSSSLSSKSDKNERNDDGNEHDKDERPSSSSSSTRRTDTVNKRLSSSSLLSEDDASDDQDNDERPPPSSRKEASLDHRTENTEDIFENIDILRNDDVDVDALGQTRPVKAPSRLNDVNPVNPVKPVNPVNPVKPANPVKPVNPKTSPNVNMNNMKSNVQQTQEPSSAESAEALKALQALQENYKGDCVIQ